MNGQVGGAARDGPNFGPHQPADAIGIASRSSWEPCQATPLSLATLAGSKVFEASRGEQASTGARSPRSFFVVLLHDDLGCGRAHCGLEGEGGQCLSSGS
jgi:hypothetical protein